MASVHFISLHTPRLPPRHSCVFYSKPIAFFPKLRPGNLRIPLTVLARSSPNGVPGTEQEFLRAVAESDEKGLPCVRTFENDLTKLTLIGAVDFEQALTAAAADGGEAAEEHIDAGLAAMVVETLYPGPSGQNSTVSTRLFLPAGKVIEKARRLRRSFTEDMRSGTTSKNILAMTFRQVVLQQLWNFELAILKPGTEMNMEDLENPREVPASLTLSSSDERVISVLAEAVCISVLHSTERNFIDDYLGKNSSSLFHWLQRPRRFVSKDSSVIITKLFEEEIVENAKSLLEDFNSLKGKFKPVRNKLRNSWWMPSTLSKLEKIGGPQFSAWASEYIPAYRIQIDSDKLKDAKFEGWRNDGENRREVLLTHSQMVGLANVIDMFYEDLFTLLKKELSCGVIGNFSNLPNKKRSSLLLKMLSVTFASGILIIAISALGQLVLPRLKVGRYNWKSKSLQSSGVESVLHQSLEAAELEALCISVVKKIKDALGWPGDIVTERYVGVWTGKLPNYLRIAGEDGSDIEDISTIASQSDNIDEEIKSSAHDIASYQVVLSLDGKIVGFQPTSRVAVNQWAANPLAKELYGGRKLSPGLIEPGLKVHQPNGVVVIELLMSTKPETCFALARSSQL
ncbi:hypothetical protein UlMin_017035 [Ulmus minor]